MELVKVPIDQLQPAAYNPRKQLQEGDPEYENIRRSIENLGYILPIIYNIRNNVIVGGHQRWQVLKDLGYEEIEAVPVDYSDEEEKAANLALNKIEGEWDMPMLKDLLQELDTGNIDLLITGFDENELEDLMTQVHMSDLEPPADFDEVDDSLETQYCCPHCKYEWSGKPK